VRDRHAARGSAPTSTSPAAGTPNNKSSGATNGRGELRRDTPAACAGSRRGAAHPRNGSRQGASASPVHGRCAATARGTSGRTGGHGTLEGSLILVEKGLSHSVRLFKIAEGGQLPSLAQLDQIGRRGHQHPCSCSLVPPAGRGAQGGHFFSGQSQRHVRIFHVPTTPPPRPAPRRGARKQLREACHSTQPRTTNL